MKKIFCDIDNTVADQYKYFLNKKKKFRKFKINDINLINLKKIPHSKKSILKLSKFFDIHWISARNKSDFKVTKLWLKKNGFPCRNIILVKNHYEKLKFLKKNKSKIYAYIDELKYNYENLEPKIMTKLIKKIKKEKINFIRFQNNWKKITNKLI